MGCNNSLLYSSNTAAQTVAVNGAINFGSVVRRCGCNINQTGSTINLRGGDYYKTDVSVVLTPTAAGTAVISLLQDGAVVATGSATVAAAATTQTISFPAIVRTRGACSSNLTLVLSGAASTVNAVNVTVEQK